MADSVWVQVTVEPAESGGDYACTYPKCSFALDDIVKLLAPLQTRRRHVRVQKWGNWPSMIIPKADVASLKKVLGHLNEKGLKAALTAGDGRVVIRAPFDGDVDSAKVFESLAAAPGDGPERGWSIQLTANGEMSSVRFEPKSIAARVESMGPEALVEIEGHAYHHRIGSRTMFVNSVDDDHVCVTIRATGDGEEPEMEQTLVGELTDGNYEFFHSNGEVDGISARRVVTKAVARDALEKFVQGRWPGTDDIRDDDYDDC